MILHRLIATVVLLLEFCYLGLWLGGNEVEARMRAFGWMDKGGANAYEAFVAVFLGWLVIVFSQLFGCWLSNPHDSLDKVCVVGGWMFMLSPVAVMWLMG